ncbi:MAG: bifunctional phosphopantothenoylcysteine decarboxylase/phosphopantothenate--cysteine ligase CoaBC [Anaerolineales bacterium]|jgi:phosphopantothenoylcysteine decarboxylase/phosphopantothenate--cysteine ligase
METTSNVSLLDGKRLLLGVTGSIAAYKAADLASRLTKAGAEVDVILTRAAQEFVTPLTFQSVTGRRAYADEDLWGSEAHILHVSLARGIDLLAIAPITANSMAKLAHGQADNLLTVLALAAEPPLLLAPAMDAGMFEHPATQANLQTLKERGAHIAGPAEGRMASGLVGLGRMLEPEALFGHIRWVLGQKGPLVGKRIVITAGGTQEPIDPVRVIANRSSGKQGFALAQAAIDLGAFVTLVAGPVHLPTPVGAERVEVRTADEMKKAVLQSIEGAETLVMAAAVADFRPKDASADKIKRRKGIPQIELEPTDDILGEVVKNKNKPGFIVGFAAESQDLEKNAKAKLKEKSLNLIVANDITAPDAGFGVDTNRVVLIDADGGIEELPLLSKAEVAERVMASVVEMMK